MTEHAMGDPAERDLGGSDVSGRAEAMRWFSRGVGIATGAALVVAILATLLVAWRVVILVFLAVLLGSALEPIVGRLRVRLPIPRGAAILIVYAVFFVAVAALLLIVVPSGIDQAGQLGAAAPGALERARGWADGLSPAVLSTSANTLIDVVARALQPGAPPQPGQIVEAGLTVVDVVVSTVTVLALIYFWMTERARLQRFALSFLPGDRRAEVHDAWNNIELRLGGWVRGQLLLMIAVGTMTGLACWLLGLPSPLLLGLIAGLAELIPMVGPAIGAIPALAVAAALRPEVLPLLIVAYLVIHVVEGNVLVPIVMRNNVGISPFLIIASLLLGGALDGLRGALLAVPIAASIEVILEGLQDREMPVAPTTEGATTAQPGSVTDPQAPAQAL